MADIFLKYVGKKPFAIDSIGGTGVIWEGNGDIQPVPEGVAEKLLKHPDQWERATSKAAEKAAAEKAAAEAGKKKTGAKESKAPVTAPEPPVTEPEAPVTEPEATQTPSESDFAA